MDGMMLSIGNFLLSSWIWSVTWGIAHLPLSMILMMFLLRFVVRIRGWQVISLPFFSHCAAGLTFSLVVVGGLVYVLGFQGHSYSMAHDGMPSDFALQASIDLGFIYAILETLFFIVTRRYYHVSIQWLFMSVVVSNGLAVWLTYRLLPLLF